jgi:hypothetical protein
MNASFDLCRKRKFVAGGLTRRCFLHSGSWWVAQGDGCHHQQGKAYEQTHAVVSIELANLKTGRKINSKRTGAGDGVIGNLSNTILSTRSAMMQWRGGQCRWNETRK